MPPSVSGTRRLAKAAFARARAFLPQTPRPAILMYHRIAQESFDPWGLAVRPSRFAAQLEWLVSRRTVLPLAELARRHLNGSLPRDAVAITFDDGYACNAELAAPILERIGVPATIFIAPQLIDRGEEFWWDELQALVLQTAAALLVVDEETIELGNKIEADHAWRPGAPPQTPRQHAIARIWAMLKPKPAAERDAAMQSLRMQAAYGKRPRAAYRPMRRDEILAVHSDAIQFGSHAMTHSCLPSLGRDAKAAEIRASLAQCETLTGKRPLSFAYPYGDHDLETRRLVEAAGFACACTTDRRSVTPGDPVFALPRIQVGDWTPWRLQRMLAA